MVWHWMAASPYQTNLANKSNHSQLYFIIKCINLYSQKFNKPTTSSYYQMVCYSCSLLYYTMSCFPWGSPWLNWRYGYIRIDRGGLGIWKVHIYIYIYIRLISQIKYTCTQKLVTVAWMSCQQSSWNIAFHRNINSSKNDRWVESGNTICLSHSMTGHKTLMSYTALASILFNH